MNKRIIMFDMDGTLTEPREPFDCKELHDQLYRLTNSGMHIGIITGSDEDYLREQMGSFLQKSSCRYKTHLLPCNGTKYFRPPRFPNEDFKMSHKVSMETELGDENYRTLIQELISSQVDMAKEKVPLTGHFINCRGSLVNWCPIGRNANSQQRSLFLDIDKKNNLRNNYMLNLLGMLQRNSLLDKVTIKLGGDTSFDIYPKGWDKTYGLRHFPNWDIWFVGDRCGEQGNDFEIYRSCGEQGFVTTGPKHTAKIISTIMNLIGSKK